MAPTRPWSTNGTKRFVRGGTNTSRERESSWPVTPSQARASRLTSPAMCETSFMAPASAGTRPRASGYRRCAHPTHRFVIRAFTIRSSPGKARSRYSPPRIESESFSMGALP